MGIADPISLFALKMALCLALFLIGAAWLRRTIERAKRARGLPPPDASPLATVRHLFSDQKRAAPLDHERQLYRQTIRILASELRRLDPEHPEAREALALLEVDRRGPGDGPSAIAAAEAPPPAAGPGVRTPEPQRAFH